MEDKRENNCGKFKLKFRSNQQQQILKITRQGCKREFVFQFNLKESFNSAQAYQTSLFSENSIPTTTF